MNLSFVGIFGFIFASFKSARMSMLKFRADFSQVLSVEGFQMIVRGAVRPHRPFALPRTSCGVPCGRMPGRMVTPVPYAACYAAA